jgi:hypothetical protein
MIYLADKFGNGELLPKVPSIEALAINVSAALLLALPATGKCSATCVVCTSAMCAAPSLQDLKSRTQVISWIMFQMVSIVAEPSLEHFSSVHFLLRLLLLSHHVNAVAMCRAASVPCKARPTTF